MKKNSLCIFLIALLSLAPIILAPQRATAEFDVFDPTNYQSAVLVLGQPDFTSSAAATTQTGMKNPRGVAVDPISAKVFVAEQNNHRILRFASVTALSSGAPAEAVLGQAGFTGGSPNRGEYAAADTLNSPISTSVDPEGRLWVADYENNRVLRFDDAANKPSGAEADGVLGQPQFMSNNPATTQNRMYHPAVVFADAGGRLWVAEYDNNRVLRFDLAALKPDGANADGVLGQADFVSSSTATTQNGMAYPTGLFLDSGSRLWVSDYTNNRLLRFDNAPAKANGANADGVLGQLDFTSSGADCTQGRMYGPRGISGDPAGQLFVVDSSNSRVLIFTGAAGLADGANADHVLGQPALDTCATNSGGISSSSLNIPTRLHYDPAARVLWVADWGNNRVLMYGSPSEFATLVLGQPNFTSRSWVTTQTGMLNPRKVAVDPSSGKVFVVDQFNNRVLRFTSLPALSNGAPAEAVFGQADFTSADPNRGGAVAADTLSDPFGVSVDFAGRMWVADAINNRVLRFDDASWRSNGAAADGVLGQADFESSYPATTRSGMIWPTDVVVQANGRLWVADFGNNRVLRFEAAAAKANGAAADGVLGQLDFTSGASATTMNGLNHPIGLFVEANPRLWIADFDNNRVLRFEDAGNKPNGANADGVLGQTDFFSQFSDCARDKLAGPAGISGGPAGRLYVADSENNRVLVFHEAAGLPNGADAEGLLGQPDYVTCTQITGGISASSFQIPSHAFFDTSASVLWVADWVNNRVLMFGEPIFKIFLPAVRR